MTRRCSIFAGHSGDHLHLHGGSRALQVSEHRAASGSLHAESQPWCRTRAVCRDSQNALLNALCGGSLHELIQNKNDGWLLATS